MKKKALTIICIVCIVFTTFGLLGYIDPTKELRPYKNPIPMPEISLDNKSHVFTDFPVDTARLNTSYRELTSHPNTLQRQQAFLRLFPTTGVSFHPYISTCPMMDMT